MDTGVGVTVLSDSSLAAKKTLQISIQLQGPWGIKLNVQGELDATLKYKDEKIAKTQMLFKIRNSLC